MLKFQLWLGSLLLVVCIAMMYVIEWSFRISELYGGGYGVLLFLAACAALICGLHASTPYIEALVGLHDGSYALYDLRSRDYESGYDYE